MQLHKTCNYRPLEIKGQLYGGQSPLIMGILNVTPDSFFDGGQHQALDEAVKHFEQMLQSGADIIDIGGESTRPGAPKVSIDEELQRVLPVFEKLNALGLLNECPVSIDTVKPEVARQSVQAGATLINDVSNLHTDHSMLDIVAEFKCAYILNHSQGTPETMQISPQYQNVLQTVLDELGQSVAKLLNAGLKRSQISIDPGIGFGKTLEHNQILIHSLEELDKLECPILMGMSRKSFIGKTPGLENSDRMIPSVAAALFAAVKGASILRVHDVKATKEAFILWQSLS